jgi:putative protein-disulfide isomerase
MCSWCWGYRPTWQKLKASLPDSIQVENLLGGLAADNDQPMPVEMQQTIAGHWKNIQSMLGTEFNFNFWDQCSPRRDTYKASRAVVAAADQGLEEEMITAIQLAYYLRAMNPSEPDTLVQLAGEIGMNTIDFRRNLLSKATDTKLRQQIRQARHLGIRSFPSLVLTTANGNKPVSLDYKNHRISLEEISELIT